MSGGSDRTQSYLHHMLGAIRRTGVYIEHMDEPAFLADTRTQDAVIRNLEIVGEAARNVERRNAAFVAAHPEIPWALAYRMRNALSHGCADVDLHTVWTTAKTVLPKLRDQVTMLVRETRGSDDAS